MDALVRDVEAKTAQARLGGGAKAMERMRSKGKKLPRERYVPRVFVVLRGDIQTRSQNCLIVGSAHTLP